jgi:hypothetical protein
MSRPENFWVVRLPEQIKRQLEPLAAKESRSPSNFVLHLVHEKLKAEGLDAAR